MVYLPQNVRLGYLDLLKRYFALLVTGYRLQQVYMYPMSLPVYQEQRYPFLRCCFFAVRATTIILSATLASFTNSFVPLMM